MKAVDGFWVVRLLSLPRRSALRFYWWIVDNEVRSGSRISGVTCKLFSLLLRTEYELSSFPKLTSPSWEEVDGTMLALFASVKLTSLNLVA